MRIDFPVPGVCLLIATLFLFATGTLAQQPWHPDEFPVGYWFGPPVAFNNLQTWQTVKNCNFSFCGPAGGYSVEENRKMLDFCRQVGIKAMVIDGRISWQMTAADDWQKTIGQVVADYGSHLALYGYFLQDEPNYELFQALGQISREFQKQDPAHLPYINLFPTYASSRQLGTPSYADYLDKFLSISKPAVLSYDHYCLLKDGTDRPDYFENLGLIREYGLRYGVPPWNIILSLPHLAYRDPTAAEMRWQVYTSLAYGMKGIMYFTYWTVPDWEKSGSIGVVDSGGKPARLYPIVQELNAEIRTLGKTLLGLTSTGVFHTGTIPQGCTRLGGDAIVKLPDDVPLVVGFFKDVTGADYAMIVNRDHAKPVEFSARFRQDVEQVTSISPRTGGDEPLTMKNHAVAFQLAAGDGMLLRLTTEFHYPEFPQPVTKVDFEFNRDGDLEGWGGFNSLTDPVVKDGILTLTFAGMDPFFIRGFLRLAPDAYTKIKVRMKLPPCEPTAQFFWTTAADPQFSDDKYLNFKVIPDGAWHEYEIPVASHPKWKGQAIRAIRLDPTSGGAKPGDKVEIDWIKGE